MSQSDSGLLPEKRWARDHAKRLGIMFAVYGVVLVPSIRARDEVPGLLRYVVAVLPTVAVAALPYVVLRSLQQVDERERALVYRAITVAFFTTGILTFGYGFLETVGAPKLSMFCVLPLMAATWIAGRFVAPRLP